MFFFIYFVIGLENPRLRRLGHPLAQSTLLCAGMKLVSTHGTYKDRAVFMILNVYAVLCEDYGRPLSILASLRPM